jgi:hypothetical protein
MFLKAFYGALFEPRQEFFCLKIRYLCFVGEPIRSGHRSSSPICAFLNQMTASLIDD